MKNHLRIAASLSLGLPLLAAACGGSSTSTFPEGTDPNANPPTGSGGGNTPGFSTDPVGTGAACVTSTANAQLAAVDLVFMYDKSGSMGDPAEGGDPTVKWNPLSVGMTSFWADPQSKGINASLQFFPADGDLTATCAAPYATPKVALTPDSAQILGAITSTKPQGGTPTLPALGGAIAYAQQAATQRVGEKAAVVLVTDGLPGFYVSGSIVPGCAENDVTHVAAAAKAAFTGTPSIPTYVIGVGPALSNLDAIAAAGGTSKAYMISVGNPAATQAAFLAALTQVRSQTVTCDFAIPPAPAGQVIDKDRVNVAYTANGKETVLSYSADCAAGAGWRYDDPNAPTRITLCPSSCAAAQADRTSGKLTIAFGCQTKQTTR